MNKKVISFWGRTKERVFRRRHNRFIDRLIEHTTIVVDGTSALQDYMKKPNKKNAAHVRQLEKEADEIRRIFIDELNRTFITPIDREDLFALSRAIDDIIDHAYRTINEMDILDVSPTNYLREMTEMLHNGADEIKLAIERIEQHPNVADTHAVRAKSIENQMEKLYAEAIADLFKKPENLNDVVDMMKLREIYRNMLYAVQSTEDAANIISDIIVKFF